MFSFFILQNCSPKSCRNLDNPSTNGGRPVCGSDNFTYPNRCLLELTRCLNIGDTQLQLTRRGSCRIQIKCEEYKIKNPTVNFKPKCRKDGFYAASQCNQLIGYCWCVTQHGIPLPYTTVKYTNGTKWPKCGKHRKSTTRRSSKSKRAPKLCRRNDKALFNTNLIKIVHTEWTREHNSAFGIANNDLDRIVLEWKFNKMDENRNGSLDKNEYRELRSIVKKAVKPTKCARQFPKSCDVDKDQSISRQEWIDCLSRDGMDGKCLLKNSFCQLFNLYESKLLFHNGFNFV